MGPDDSWVCPICGDDDVDNLREPSVGGSDLFTCANCGANNIDITFEEFDLFRRRTAKNQLVSDDVLRALASDDFVLDTSLPALLQFFRPAGKTYNRNAHFNERLSQHLCREPEIPEEHLALIKVWCEKMDKDSLWYSRRIHKKLKKEDIRRLLRLIDKKRKEKPKFTSLYLEKWKSIRADIYGDEAPVLKWENVIKILSILSRFSAKWKEIQTDSQGPRFPNRIHFPNINYIILEIARYEDIKLPVEEFPPPKTAKCREKLKKYFLELCKELQYGPFDSSLISNQEAKIEKPTNQLTLDHFFKQ
jgi:hypothetical protein